MAWHTIGGMAASKGALGETSKFQPFPAMLAGLSRHLKEVFMIGMRNRSGLLAAAGVGGALLFGSQIWAQEATSSPGRVISRDEITPNNSAHNVDQHVADGQRHGLPLETYAVVPGTRFLVSLEQDLNTKELHQNQTFRVRTLEPLEAGAGIYLPSGVEIRGHI